MQVLQDTGSIYDDACERVPAGPRCRRRLPTSLLAACALWAGLVADAAPPLLAGVALLVGLVSEAGAQESAATDRAALEALYDATGGSGWIDNTNWKTAAPLGEWFGVTIDPAGRVTRLALPGNGLAGPMPAALGELALLRDLDFASRWDSVAQQSVENTLTGPIPVELGNLSSLESLDLGDNALSGPIPAELGSLANLVFLRLDGNELPGPIPPGLGRLTRLEWLSLQRNGLTGRVPDELGSLANLVFLHLESNELTGPIPAWLGRLTRLESLSLGDNALSGPIPAELGGLTNLVFLYLHRNRLTGPVPAVLGSLAGLETLDLQFNPLTGSLPPSLTRLLQLMRLDISNTAACAPANVAFQEWLATIDFRGNTCNRRPEPVDTIPLQALAESGPAIGVPMAAYFTDPDDDPLTYVAASGHAGTVTALASGDTVWLVPGAPGTVTVTVTARDPGGLSATQTMTVTTAGSTGPQSDREVLEVLYDGTSGPGWTNRRNWKTSAPLGAWYGVTTDAAGRVTRLELADNDLVGPIPAWLGDLADLRWLVLGSNDLTGPIPDELGRLADLEVLNLAGNDLTNPIPASLGNLAGLRDLILGGNALTGPIPDALRRLMNLETLALDGNDLTGPLPASLGNLVNLQRLWLARNGLAGPLPAALGDLTDLESLELETNHLTGPLPASLGNLANLRTLRLGGNGLTGPLPAALGSLSNLRTLGLSYNWGLSGSLPAGMERLSLEGLDIFATQACAPAAWRERLAAIDFTGRLCGADSEVVIDVAVFHTRAAREAAGGAAAIAAVIDLMVAEANQAYTTSAVRQRLRLVERLEVAYDETGDSGIDLDRFIDPSDGRMDEVHAVRDRVGADLVHLIVDADRASFAGLTQLSGAFGLTVNDGGGPIFAHELGHNMGLWHDRYEEHQQGVVQSHPAFGYVNQRGFAAGAARARRWKTVMAYVTQCWDAYAECPELFRFSNPRQDHAGDPLGVLFGSGELGVAGPADAAAVLGATGPAVALWRDPPRSANRPPSAVGTLPDRRLTPSGTLEVNVSGAFVDPDGDVLAYAVSSSGAGVVTVRAVGARVTLTAFGEGTAAIRVTATDPGGLTAVQQFRVTVAAAVTAPFTDDPIAPGVTPVKAVHFTELRTRIDALRAAAGLARFRWTDPVLRVGVTRVRLVHLLELRSALAEAYRAAGRAAPRWTDAAPAPGSIPIRALHVTELRAAVLALE